MIKWHRNITYFLHREYNEGRDFQDMIDEFKQKYGCDEFAPHHYICSEENFLLIKLTCPEVIATVLDHG
jgi:hypothetical protein